MKWKTPVVAIGIASALLLSGCAAGGNAPVQGAAALTIAKPDGAIATESNNP